jgi:RNA polymerase sigma factor (sigma-70 family)
MRGPGAAEDVVQDAMVRVLTYSSSVRGINARGWLLQIVRNTAYTSAKIDRAVQLVPLAAPQDEEVAALPELPSDDEDPRTSLIRSRHRSQVQRLIGALPVELRETLVLLRELEELSYKEIAEVTHTMSRLWRARRLLVPAATEHREAS